MCTRKPQNRWRSWWNGAAVETGQRCAEGRHDPTLRTPGGQCRMAKVEAGRGAGILQCKRIVRKHGAVKK